MTSTTDLHPPVSEGAAPQPGTWRIDPGHTEVAFIGRHFMLTKIRGRFVGVEGSVAIASDPTDSHVEVTIDMTSVNSGAQDRDDHLRSPDFFDTATWPTARFGSTAVSWSGTTASMTGDLTIRNVTRPLTLSVEYLGQLVDPWGSTRAVFSATGTIDRGDWGLDWNMPLDRGGLLVSQRIDLEINVEMILEPSGG